MNGCLYYLSMICLSFNFVIFIFIKKQLYLINIILLENISKYK